MPVPREPWFAVCVEGCGSAQHGSNQLRPFHRCHAQVHLALAFDDLITGLYLVK